MAPCRAFVFSGGSITSCHEPPSDFSFILGVQLWATENPLVNSVDSFERKLDAGAEAIITQPPLLPDAFEKWYALSRGSYVDIVRQEVMLVSIYFVDSGVRPDFCL